KQATAFDVNRADAVTKDHYSKNEPRGGRANRLLDDAANVVGRAGQVAEDDGSRPPIRNEGEHDAADDDHLGGLQNAFASAGWLRRSRIVRRCLFRLSRSIAAGRLGR